MLGFGERDRWRDWGILCLGISRWGLSFRAYRFQVLPWRSSGWLLGL